MNGQDSARGSPEALRLVLIGAGWISGYHLAALDRLERTRLVGVSAGWVERARAVAGARDATGYAGVDLERMLDIERPDVAVVCVPPATAVSVLERLVERGIPFLTEKPLAATDAEGPARIAAAVADRRLVAAVGYHLRGLEALAEVRSRLATNPAQLVTARWLTETPAPAWWRREATGGGQVIEMATHSTISPGCSSARRPSSAQPRSRRSRPSRRASTSSTRRPPSSVSSPAPSAASPTAGVSRRRVSIEVELVCPNLLITIRKLPEAQTTWEVILDDGGVRTIAAGPRSVRGPGRGAPRRGRGRRPVAGPCRPTPTHSGPTA